MARKKSSRDLEQIRKRLGEGSLTKQDVSVVDEILVAHIESYKAIERATEKLGGKKVIARLPLGFDIVK